MHIKTSALALLLAFGCGDLADSESKPPALTTLRGSLRVGASTSLQQGALRLALVWHLPDQEERPYELCDSVRPDRPYVSTFLANTVERRFLLDSIQQAVDITPQFPSAFELQVTALPPSEAFHSWTEGVRIAEGELVAYRDGNGNGKLDPRPTHGAGPDEVLSPQAGAPGAIWSEDPRTGTRPMEYEVWYLDKPHDFGGMLNLQAGYNVLEYGSYGARPTDRIDLELLPTPGLQVQLCTDDCLALEGAPFDCPANPAADLPRPPADAQSGSIGTGTSTVWTDGPDSWVVDDKLCVKTGEGYLFLWHRERADGCVQRKVDECRYGPLPEPSPDWPCSDYFPPYGTDSSTTPPPDEGGAE